MNVTYAEWPIGDWLAINETANGTNLSSTGDEVTAQFSPAVMILMTIAITLMAVLTIGGNVLVIAAFVVEEKLRKYSNYFILNLSIADLFMGVVCIPLYGPFLILGEWRLSHAMCIIWLVFDYVVGSASVLCIVVISLDRYRMVSRGLDYISEQKTTRAILWMIGTWFVAFLNYGPAIVLWEHWSGERKVPDGQCFVEFRDNLPYLVASAGVEFFGPLLSITSLNLMVYMNIRRRSKGLLRTKSKPIPGQAIEEEQQNCLQPPPPPATGEGDVSPRSLGPTSAVSSELSPRDPLPQPTPRTARRDNPYAKSGAKLARDKKAARSLFILVLVFCFCWAPYTLLTLIRAVCMNCVNSDLYEVSFWLLWFNSTVNPILYPFLHVHFRRAFITILRRLVCCPAKKGQQHRATPRATPRTTPRATPRGK